MELRQRETITAEEVAASGSLGCAFVQYKSSILGHTVKMGLLPLVKINPFFLFVTQFYRYFAGIPQQ